MGRESIVARPRAFVFCPLSSVRWTKDRRQRTKDLGHWTLDGRFWYTFPVLPMVGEALRMKFFR